MTAKSPKKTEEAPEEEAAQTVEAVKEDERPPETITLERVSTAFKKFAFHVRRTVVQPLQQAADELLDELEGKAKK